MVLAHYWGNADDLQGGRCAGFGFPRTGWDTGCSLRVSFFVSLCLPGIPFLVPAAGDESGTIAVPPVRQTGSRTGWLDFYASAGARIRENSVPARFF